MKTIITLDKANQPYGFPQLDGNGNLIIDSISATTYQNLPKDIYVTGGTYSNGTSTFRNNSGGTFNVTGYFTGSTDNYITGGTFNHNTSTLSLNNVTGGTIEITGFTDVNVTGGTYSNGTTTFTNNTGGTFNVSGFTTPFTGGTVSGGTIFTNGLTANTISATTYYNLPKLQNVITVAKSGGDFTSIKSAVDSITNSSSSNRYVVSVAPGRYVEDPIVLQGKEFLSIVGTDILETLVVAADPNQYIFVMGNNNQLSFMTISGATSGVGILCENSIGFSLVHKISLYDCNTHIYVHSTSSNTSFYGEYVDLNGTYSYGVKVLAENGFTSYANMENYYNFPTGIGTTIANSVQGSGSTLSVFVGDGIGNGVSGSTNYQISDYASLNTISTTADNWGYGVRVLNIGGPSRFDIDSISIVDSIVYDLSVEHPGTFGTYGGSSTNTKIYNLSDSVYWTFLDTIDGEFEVTRKISVTFQDGTHTDMSTLIFQGSTMGLMSGGTITINSGLNINVSSGFGYLQNSSNSTIYQRVDWGLTGTTLTSNSNLYLYFNQTGNLYTSGTRPNTINNIVIGRVVTNSTGVEFIDSSPMNADHTSNRFGNLFRNALGPIYSSGSIVTQNTTPFKLNVTSGEYYFSSNQYLPIGGSGLTFTQYYRNGSGGWNTSATTFVNNTQFDNNGTLSGLTVSAFTKHTLYVVGSGVNEKYFLVLGQNQYTTLVETENALLPTPPTFFSDSVSEIANIYIRQGLSGITQIEDIRPVIGFRAGGVSSSSLHANLLGLASDDHKQYLLVDGSRSMSGVLNMSGNSIINSGTINNVTIESHASRHKNGGDDEVATSTPAPSEIPKADTFGKLDGWISDSSSSVKGLTKLTVNPVSSTSPIAVGENDLRFQKSITGVTNTSNTLSFSNVTGETINFTGLTLGSISATTYQNLPATPFLPLSGGTVSGATVFTVGITANTISATTYQNLPLDIRVTGGTYSNGTTTFTNNTGGTFNVTGYYNSGYFTGGTVSGTSVFTGGLTANTISATTITANNISGTTNYVSKFTGVNSLGNSIIYDNGTNVGIGTTSPTNKLDVSGTTRLNGLQTFQGTTASDGPTLGTELAISGTGTNWSGTSFSLGYTHTTGATSALTSTLAANIGTYYQIAYTVTGRTSGSFQIDFGGASNSGLSATGAWGPIATTTGTLVITPTTDFNGTVILSIKTISTSVATTTFTNSSGTTVNEIRNASSYTNLFMGIATGRRVTTGTNNTFLGTNSGLANTTASNNTFLGTNAGAFNTTSSNNTFLGTSAGYSNISGPNNTFIGTSAGYSNTSGNGNTYIGQAAGFANITSISNTFIGYNAGNANIGNAGSGQNTGVGTYALDGNTTGTNNSVLGYAALRNNLNGSNNVAIGGGAGRYISGGVTVATSVGSSIFIGGNAYPLADFQTNQIVIGTSAIGLGSNTTVLGNSSTITTALYGRLLLGPTIDNGLDKVQISDITLAGSGSLAGSLLNMTQTWNTSGIPSAIKLNITDTLSNTASSFIDCQISSSSVFKVTKQGKLILQATNTAPGTTGAQTINKPSGKVNAAAGTTSLVVTNSLVTTASIVICQLGTNDATCDIKSVVEGAGLFTINYTAPTAETVIKFQVIN